MIKEFNKVCEFRELNPVTKGNLIKTNDPRATSAQKNLEALSLSLEEKFKTYKGVDLIFKYSLGAANYPNILHTTILPPHQKVSNGIYVVICFDIEGKGALVGCAESVTSPKGLKTVIRKKRGVNLDIDVDGGRPTTKYNNAFENPKEFYEGKTSEIDLIEHIKISLDIALNHLAQINKDLTILQQVEKFEEEDDFNPNDTENAKEKISRQITARRGQFKFRKKLLSAYESKCAITSSDIEAVLEAAHIMPYNGKKTNHIQNGILLRSDIHLLFDLNLLTIDASTFKVRIHKNLLNTYYSKYNNLEIKLPKSIQNHPNIDALKYHNDEFMKTR